MNDNYTDPYLDEEEEEEGSSIDWMKYLRLLWAKRKRIIIITFCFAVMSVVIALTQNRKYSVTVVMAPEIQNRSSSSSSLRGIASMLGLGNLTMGSSTDALNIMLFPEILSSTPFLKELLDVELTPYVSPKKLKEGAEPGVPTTVYKHLTGEDREPGLLRTLKENIFGSTDEELEDADSYDPATDEAVLYGLTKRQEKVIRRLRKLLGAEVDKKTGVTVLNVKLDDPLMTMQLADTICNRLQLYVYEYRTLKERSNYEYYSALTDSAYQALVESQTAYAQSLDNDHNVILQSISVRRQRLQNEVNLREQIYTQMVTQREMARARVQEEKPVFAVIEPAVFPYRAANSRAKTCIAITMFGFIVTCFWYLLGKSLIVKIKGLIASLNEEEE